MIVIKVISGGQIGADIAGLRLAKRLGIETGGWMPMGFKTLVGNKPEYQAEYNLVDCNTEDYPTRTEYNVKDSDGTVRFAYDFESPGERCTLKAIKKYSKPYFDVLLYGMPSNHYYTVQAPEELAEWIFDNGINVLNVAGNANQRIEDTVERFLFRALALAQ